MKDVQLRVVVEGAGPLCILVHGWPELWFSWRHQIAPLVAAGFRVAVPDLRGYGGSDCPAGIEAYTMDKMVGDVVGIADALRAETFFLVGHDWGAPIVWETSLRHPERVRAVAGLSVPYIGRLPAPPTQLLGALYAERFFYMLYFQEPGVAEAEFEADVRASLAKIYYANSGDVSQAVRRAVRARTRSSGYLEGMIVPDPLPDWLTEDELDYYAEQFERSGFRGGLNRYRNLDEDWRRSAELAGRKITPPCLFMAGEHDSVLRYVPGLDIRELMVENTADLRGFEVVPGAGHWVQQENPGVVNRLLLDFLGQVLGES